MSDKKIPRTMDDVTYNEFMDMFNKNLLQINFGGPTLPTHTPAVKKEPSLTWDDIGGQEEAKAALRKAIELPHLHPELYKKYNRKPPKGILLYGPPGCGKTILARAAATCVGGDGTDAFIYVKATEMFQPYVGQSEENVRHLFARARSHYKRTGKQSVIFIDEADACMSRRSNGGFLRSFLVNTFLAEMDGAKESGAYVILATNRPDDLDEAITRDGRIDNKIFVGRPDRATCEKILNIHMKGVPCGDVAAFVNASMESLYGGTAFYKYQIGGEGEWFSYSLSDKVNGAMLAGFVRRAVDLAIERDIAGSCSEPTGVTPEDGATAVHQAFKEVEAAGTIEDFVDHLKDKNVMSALIRKVTAEGLEEVMDVDVDGKKVRVQTPGGGALN